MARQSGSGCLTVPILIWRAKYYCEGASSTSMFMVIQVILVTKRRRKVPFLKSLKKEILLTDRD